MEYLSLQEILNVAVKGLASQGFKRATSASGNVCVYRSTPSKKVKCAVGWLIPDNKYGLWMESHTFPDGQLNNFKRDILKVCKVDPSDVSFISDLQQAHDRAYGYVGSSVKKQDDSDKMKRNLLKLTEKYGLKAPKELRDA